MPDDSPFIQPSSPVLKSAPPSGPGWIHEVKFDGWRVQLHKRGEAAMVFSRRGRDFTNRVRFIRDAVVSMPATGAGSTKAPTAKPQSGDLPAGAKDDLPAGGTTAAPGQNGSRSKPGEARF